MSKRNFVSKSKQFGKFKVTTTASVMPSSNNAECLAYVTVGEHLISVVGFRIEDFSDEKLEKSIDVWWNDFVDCDGPQEFDHVEP